MDSLRRVDPGVGRCTVFWDTRLGEDPPRRCPWERSRVLVAHALRGSGGVAEAELQRPPLTVVVGAANGRSRSSCVC